MNKSKRSIKMIAVLTGDLAHSTKMPTHIYTQTIELLQLQLTKVNDVYGANGEVYRGDAFQIQYPTLTNALKSTLLIKLALYTADFSDLPIAITLSLAYGEYDIYDKKPNTSSGPVFIASGRGLENTARGDLSLSLPEKNQNEIKLLTQFLNHLLNRLTKTQAQLLSLYIERDFPEHKEMAKITGTTRQNISNRLSNIGAFLIRDYIKTIHTKIGNK